MRLPIVFLSRHDKGHRISPTDINYRANIDVLKRAGVTDLVSLSACGSFKEDGIFYPGHWGLFGGAMEPGEAADAALRRELQEELGLAAPEMQHMTELFVHVRPAWNGDAPFLSGCLAGVGTCRPAAGRGIGHAFIPAIGNLESSARCALRFIRDLAACERPASAIGAHHSGRSGHVGVLESGPQVDILRTGLAGQRPLKMSKARRHQRR